MRRHKFVDTAFDQHCSGDTVMLLKGKIKIYLQLLDWFDSLNCDSSQFPTFLAQIKNICDHRCKENMNKSPPYSKNPFQQFNLAAKRLPDQH